MHGGEQVDGQPQQAAARGRQHGGEHVFLVAQTGAGHHFVRGFFGDDVDHVVDGDAPEQQALSHRPPARTPGRGRGTAARPRAPAAPARCAAHPDPGTAPTSFSGIVGEQARQRERAQEAVAPVHHEQPVGAVGQFAAHAQVALHHFQRHVGAHAHRVGAHQAAGASPPATTARATAARGPAGPWCAAAAASPSRAGRRAGRRGRRPPCLRWPRPVLPRPSRGSAARARPRRARPARRRRAPDRSSPRPARAASAAAIRAAARSRPDAALLIMRSAERTAPSSSAVRSAASRPGFCGRIDGNLVVGFRCAHRFE